MLTMHVIVICIIRDNYVLGPVWAVHIEFNKKKSEFWFTVNNCLLAAR